jgi:hypothetical protein
VPYAFGMFKPGLASLKIVTAHTEKDLLNARFSGVALDEVGLRLVR